MTTDKLLGLLDTWTPIASRNREPRKRERLDKNGATRVVLYSNAWTPVDNAPLSLADAHELASDGMLVKCLKYDGDQEHVVVRRSKALAR